MRVHTKFDTIYCSMQAVVDTFIFDYIELKGSVSRSLTITYFLSEVSAVTFDFRNVTSLPSHINWC